jgi:Subtilase family/Purple acid Phosphatase, N-terminal domain
MRFKTAAAVLAVLVLAALGPWPAGASEENTAHSPRRALVGAHKGQKGQAEQAIRAHGGRVISYYEPGDFFVVETPSRAPEWARGVRDEDEIRYAEADYELSIDDTIPNDPRFTDLYGMQKIQAPKAWDTSTGSSSVVVGVIDTGVDYNHEDLAGNMWVNTDEIPNNGIDDDGNGWRDDVHGADCINSDGNPMDDHGHGTHVSGTIGAVGNNLKGVAGVNWDVGIMALKFLGSDGKGSTFDAIECIDYAIANGAHLSNNSWGGGGSSNALRDAIQRAALDNQLFVAAAGNGGLDQVGDNNDTTPHYPSSYSNDNIIAVAATGSSDNLATFSNYGSTSVDLAAPGVSILSSLPGNQYGFASGTSMATPHVAGAAALLLSTMPNALYPTVRDRIFQSVDQLSTLSGKVATGGRLNVGRAIGPSTLTISNLTVSPARFSPNGDGVKDVTTIGFSLNKAATWTIQVGGRTFTGSTVGPTTVSQTWDGKDSLNVTAPDGTYSVTVSATNGVEADTEQGSVTVDTIGPSISGVAATNITDRSADVVWNTNELSTSKVEYGTAPGIYGSSTSTGSLVTAHKLSLTGLTPSTTYYYKVTSIDDVGNKAVSSEQSFKTQAGPPPLTVSVAKVSSSAKGKNYSIDLRTTVTSPGGTGVAGASVSLKVGSGACPVGSALSTLTGTTDANGNVTLTFKTRNTGTYCGSSTATKAGFSQGTGSTAFSVP